jgi:hypothetical protein
VTSRCRLGVAAFSAALRRRARMSAALIRAIVSLAAIAESGALSSSSKASGASRSAHASSAAGKYSRSAWRSRWVWRVRSQINVLCDHVTTFTAPAAALSAAGVSPAPPSTATSPKQQRQHPLNALTRTKSCQSVSFPLDVATQTLVRKQEKPQRQNRKNQIIPRSLTDRFI